MVSSFGFLVPGFELQFPVFEGPLVPPQELYNKGNVKNKLGGPKARPL